jgi:hypothetical protein
VQREIVWRPPAYYTPDWRSARESVRRLAALQPEVAATGHGHPMRGIELRDGLHALAEQFEAVRPHRGRYVDRPAIADESGVIWVPPAVGPSRAAITLGAAALVGAGVFAARRVGSRR